MTWNKDDVRNLLSDTNLKTLRDAYEPYRKDMNTAATTTAANPYEESKEFVASIGNRFFMQANQPSHLTARDRERVIIALLSAGYHPPFTLAVHFYWGLMEGLEVWEIGETVLLVGAYRGIDSFTDAMFTFQQALKLLSKLAAAGGEAIVPMKILAQLIAAFRPPTAS